MNRGVLLGVVLPMTTAVFADQAELRPPGFAPRPPGVHALTGAEVHVRPDTVLSNATIVIRDGWIEAVGADLTPPPEARVWDCKGQVVYAGFLDPLIPVSGTNPPLANTYVEFEGGARPMTAAGGPYFGIHAADRPAGAASTGDRLPSVTPERRIAEAYAPNAKLNEELREVGFTAANIVPEKGIYRGWSAVVALGDGPASRNLLHADTAQHLAFETTRSDQYPGSLMGAIAVVRQTAFDAAHYRDSGDPLAPPRPGVPRPEPNASLGALRSVVDGKAQVVFEPGSALLEHRAWMVSRELGFKLQLVASGEEWRRPDLIREIAEAGVPFIVPAVFPALPKLPQEEDWDAIDLDRFRAWDWAPENPALLRQLGASVALSTYGIPDRKEFRANVRAAVDRGLSETDAIAGLTTVPARLCGVEGILGSIEPGKLANLTITGPGGYFSEDAKMLAVWVDGEPHLAPPAAPEKKKDKKDEKKEGDGKEDGARKKKELRELAAKRVAKPPRITPEKADRPPAVLVTSATIWTSGPQGVLTNAALLVVDGKIAYLGDARNAPPTANALHLDLPGAHVTAGVIDCHSHSMILGAVNESNLPSTAMCRIGDVVNSEAPTIHEQLAGGVTVANLLHGSANPIGGQNCVIKLREGAGPEGLKFTNAPQGVKFALGENVKQSNWGDKYSTRYPQSRMGVPVFYANRFTAARQYLAAWKAWRDGGANGPGPRRDLELEALGEILEGTRLIHCHSYRQDEILAFLRTMESFGVRVATLQHVLEGYKVADEIARHGAGGSCFADWWAYKYEVIDAIPYAGSMMHDRGVVVSFNSDSSDHARRLNFEAAKAVHYGDTTAEAALDFVTLNPAKQLRIDRWVGSLEVGKDGDFAVWNGNPLDSSSLCLQTWIEGVRYFDRSREAQRSAALADERGALLAKSKKLAGDGGDGAGGKPAGAGERDLFFRATVEHDRDHDVVDCLDREAAR